MVDVTWLVMWAVAGWLIGILVFFAGGFVVHALPERFFDVSKKVNGTANHYSKIAMKLLGRGVLVERGTKFDLYRTSHDPEKNADQFSLGGETAHVTNDTGLLSTLHKKPFGLVPPPDENVATYVSPEIAEFGRIEADRKEQDELRDGGVYDGDVAVPARRPLVQLRDYARHMIPGTRSLYDLDETVDLYKQSQRLFGETKTTQFMILIVAYGVAMSVTWLVLTQGGGAVPSGGGGGVPVPPMGG